jgi:hypothetical protein
MKKLIGLGFLAAVLSFSLSCEKEDLYPEYPFTITVKTLADSIPTQNTYVEILATRGATFSTFFEGYTDENGDVSFTYEKDAVFTVRATRGKNPYTYIGCTEVRLMPNEHVYKNVYLIPYDDEVRGCTSN